MTPETQNTAEAPKGPVSEEIIVKRSLFDLEKFERKAAETKINFTPAASMAEFLARIDNDEARALKVANAGLRRIAITEAKQSMGSENLVSPKVVSGFVVNFKPKFPATGDTKEAKKAQLAKIYEFMRGIPALVVAIKEIAKVSMDDVDDEDDEVTGAE